MGVNVPYKRAHVFWLVISHVCHWNFFSPCPLVCSFSCLTGPKTYFCPKISNKLSLCDPGFLNLLLWFLDTLHLYNSFPYTNFSQNSSTVICLGHPHILISQSLLLHSVLHLLFHVLPFFLVLELSHLSQTLSLRCGNKCVCLLCPTMHRSHSNYKSKKATRVPVSARATKREREIHICMLL